MQRYNPKDIEPKWQQKWQESQIFAVTEDSDKPKKYIIDMFPYPSGAAMHVGHMRNYTISDVISQFHRQKGYNVMHTMGWDTFGLPAENYAIKTGVPPQQSTKQNIANFTSQLKQLGMSYDWNREINTSDPEYYRWTQWIFTKLFEKGLAYQKESLQWWCETDKTVLANEQVEAGKCWRCGNEVIKKSMKQWFFKITDYADALLDGIDDLDWPEKIKTMQRNWIGRSQGAAVTFTTGNTSSLVAKDTLKFTPELTKLVQDGSKNVTFRLEPKDLKVGDTVQLITRFDAQKTQAFAYATVTRTEVLKLRDIALDYPGHEQYASKEEQLASYRTYYGDHVTLDSDVYIYEFEKISDVLTVFTTRPDTIYGATFLVIAPEHALTKALATDEQKTAVEAYIAASLKKSEIERQENKEKTGVFTGSYATNPASGEQIPIWTSDYVLAGYGTGAIMAVPAHDERDYEFARKFDLPIVQVVKPVGVMLDNVIGESFADTEKRAGLKGDARNDRISSGKEVYSFSEGVLINSGEFDGMTTSEAREKIVQRLEAEDVAKPETTYKMRDWLISRQRYWGAPIPIIHCPDHGAVAVPEDQLPVRLPEVTNYEPTGGETVLAGVQDWVNVACPECGKPSKRETDTMDGYACSSWYFLRYADPKNSEQAWAPDKANYWLPVDYYCGGDHAVSHLLYSRFWFHFFAGQGWIEHSRREPVGKLVYNGYILAEDGRKMSKSLGNTINPTDIIDQGYGADALRLFEMFIAPYELSTNWNTNGVPGTYRFLQRIWTLSQEFAAADAAEDETAAPEILRATHGVIKRVTQNLEQLSFNTAVAGLMEYVNDLYKLKAAHGYGANNAWQFALTSLTQLIAPFAPHIAEELWQSYGNTSSVHTAPWPEYDEKYLVSDTITIPVQINGKVRAQLTVGAHEDQAAIEAAALANDRVQQYLDDKKPIKIIYIPGRLISIVV